MLEFIIAATLGAASGTDFCILTAEERGTGLAIIQPDGELLARVQVGSWPHEVEVSRDGRTAYVTQFGITDYDSRIGTPGDHVSRIDLASARETGRYALPEGLRAPHGVKLRPSSDELFVNAEAGHDTMLVYDADSRRLLRTFPLEKGSHNFVFSSELRKTCHLVLVSYSPPFWPKWACYRTRRCKRHGVRLIGLGVSITFTPYTLRVVCVILYRRFP